ncbi:MAG: hypothetical protein DRJ03_24360, partial [Chloroflexi bacterium]
MSDLWTQEIPKIPDELGSTCTRHRWQWVRASEHFNPIPAEVTFLGGEATAVTLLGQTYSYYAASIYSWGPLVTLVDMVKEATTEYDEADVSTGPSLEESRLLVEEGSEKGVKCPCCDQYCKIYKQKLYTTMAKFLVELVAAVEDVSDSTWIDVRHDPRFLRVTRNGNYAYLLHWGLVEQQPNLDSAKRTSGMWRPTAKGISFVKGLIDVPTHVHIFDNKIRGWATTTFR